MFFQIKYRGRGKIHSTLAGTFVVKAVDAITFTIFQNIK